MLKLLFFTLLFPKRGHRQRQSSPVTASDRQGVDLKFETPRKLSSTTSVRKLMHVGCQAAM